MFVRSSIASFALSGGGGTFFQVVEKKAKYKSYNKNLYSQFQLKRK